MDGSYLCVHFGGFIICERGGMHYYIKVPLNAKTTKVNIISKHH